MNSQKKRLAAYFLIISLGLLIAFLFLKKKPSEISTTIAEPIIKKDSVFVASLLSEFFDFENNTESFVSNEKALSGKNSCKFSDQIEFGVSSKNTIIDLPNFSTLKNIAIKYSAFFLEENPDALYVLSINDEKGKNVHWDSQPIIHNPSNSWTETKIDFAVPPQFLKSENTIVLYPWNRNKKIFFLDNISIDFIGDAVFRAELKNESEKSNLFFDFETEAGLSTADNVKETTAHSGKKACDLSGGKEYGPSVSKIMAEVSAVFPKKISMSAWVYPLTDNPNIVLTASVVNKKKETVFWDGEGSENKAFPKNQWTKINTSFSLPTEKFSSTDILGVGIWNKGKTDIIVDDIEIVYGESAERRGEPSKIDPTSIYEKRFVSEQNKPPFKTIYFEKQEVGNELETFTPNDIFLVGNFSSEAKMVDELLCISKKKQALFTYDVSKRTFKKIWENNTPNDELWNTENNYIGNIVNGKHSLVIQQKNKPVATCLSFDGKAWQKTGDQNIVPAPSVSNPISMFSGQFTNKKNQTLKLDRTWRFDLKLLDDDFILGNVDFKGYPNDYNPKYYELVKLVPGNFMSNDHTSLLVIMCNCADANFTGTHCNQIENLSYLPNKVELYSIQKEKGLTQMSETNANK